MKRKKEWRSYVRRLHISTLHQFLTKVRDKDKPEKKTGSFYKINCSYCKYPLSEKLQKQPHDWTQTRGNNRWRQNSHRWTLFTLWRHYQLGLYVIPDLQLQLLTTTDSGQQIYYLRTDFPQKMPKTANIIQTSYSRYLQTNRAEENDL